MNMWYDVIVLITIELIPVDNLVKQTSAISCLHVFYLFIYYLSIFSASSKYSPFRATRPTFQRSAVSCSSNKCNSIFKKKSIQMNL